MSYFIIEPMDVKQKNKYCIDNQGSAEGRRGVSPPPPPQYFEICKKVGQKLARLPRGLATVFSVTFSLIKI